MRRVIRIGYLIFWSGWAWGSHPAIALQQDGGHIGSVDQALVAIEVTSSSADGAAQNVRRGNGFILRCDGVVLAPIGLFSRTVQVAGLAEDAGKQSIAVYVRPGTAQEKRYAGRRPKYFGKEIGYVAFRLDGFHGPG